MFKIVNTILIIDCSRKLLMRLIHLALQILHLEKKTPKLLPKLSDFINYDDCIEKITTEYIRLYPVFIQKKI